MTTDMTRRLMLGALPAFGFAGGLAAPAFAEHQPPMATPEGDAEGIDLTSTLDAWVDAYGRPTAKVMLNGQGPFSFLVDTGSTTTVLAARHVETLGAPITGIAKVAGTTGVAETPVARLALIETGAVTKKDMRVAILPDANLARVDGILGADIFAGRKLVFDIQAKTVRVETARRSVRAMTRTNLKVRNGLLAEIDGRVGSVATKLMLDTGAQNCIANMALDRALRGAYPRLMRVNDVSIYGVTGHVITGQYLALPKVEMRAFAVKDATAVAADAPIFDIWGLNDEPAMIVGVNLLSRLRSFSIDYRNKIFEADLLAQLIANNPVAFG
jgi:Aspartyl protease